MGTSNNTGDLAGRCRSRTNTAAHLPQSVQEPGEERRGCPPRAQGLSENPSFRLSGEGVGGRCHFALSSLSIQPACFLLCSRDARQGWEEEQRGSLQAHCWVKQRCEFLCVCMGEAGQVVDTRNKSWTGAVLSLLHPGGLLAGEERFSSKSLMQVGPLLGEALGSWMKRLRNLWHREVKQLLSGHTTRRWQSQDMKPGSLALDHYHTLTLDTIKYSYWKKIKSVHASTPQVKAQLTI